MQNQALDIRTLPDERPTILADAAGADYASRVSVDHRKNHGLYLTPVSVAEFMAAQIGVIMDSSRNPTLSRVSRNPTLSRVEKFSARVS
jgi:hypothetical protein